MTTQGKIIAHTKLRFDTDYRTFYDANWPIRRLLSTMLSIPHMIVVFIVVLVVFGPQKLPELAKGLGKLMAEFRKASTDFKSAFEEEMREMERQALQAERKKATETVSAEPTQASALAAPSGAEAATSESRALTHEIETPVISPVPESVPRSDEESAQIKSEDSQNPLHDTQHPT